MGNGRRSTTKATTPVSPSRSGETESDYFLVAFFFAPTVFFGPLRVRAFVFVR